MMQNQLQLIITSDPRWPGSRAGLGGQGTVAVGLLLHIFMFIHTWPATSSTGGTANRVFGGIKIFYTGDTSNNSNWSRLQQSLLCWYRTFYTTLSWPRKIFLGIRIKMVLYCSITAMIAFILTA